MIVTRSRRKVEQQVRDRYCSAIFSLILIPLPVTVVSILGWILIVFLTFFEIRNYMTPKFQERMAVDTSLGEQLMINVNITFHSLNCNEAHLDVMDVAGDNQLSVEHDMIKQRIDKFGRPIGKAGVEIIGEGKLDVPDLPKDYCGSCYGAETPARK